MKKLKTCIVLMLYTTVIIQCYMWPIKCVDSNVSLFICSSVDFAITCFQAVDLLHNNWSHNRMVCVLDVTVICAMQYKGISLPQQQFYSIYRQQCFLIYMIWWNRDAVNTSWTAGTQWDQQTPACLHSVCGEQRCLNDRIRWKTAAESVGETARHLGL